MSPRFSPPTLQEAMRALYCIPADIVRDDWVMLAAVVHNEFGDAAFPEFDTWSSTGSSYTPQAMRDTWRSCKKLTRYRIGSLIYLAKQHGYEVPNRYPVTHAEHAAIEHARMQLQNEREARDAKFYRECTAAHALAARSAVRRWDHGSTTEPGTHPYLVRKKIGAHGTRRELCDDAENSLLLIPIRDVEGNLHGVQEITPEGAKNFPFGTAKKGHFHAFGAPLTTTVIVGEGFATMATFAEYRDYADAALVTAFDAGNLMPVVHALRTKYPDLQIVIAADWDSPPGGDGGRGYRAACAAAIKVDGEVIHPEPIPGSLKTDFNDLHVLQSQQADRRAA